ncbi:MAG TPA: FG-GAP repeat protein, partial [Chitinophagaceae bacterium]|nr:FG-GAP repeat protein [Chitinophagaceae bacterium]
MRIPQTTILLIYICAISSCHQKKTLFESMSSSRTGVGFVNKIEENDKYNVLNYMNMYTGAGVAAGDINNDGLTDLFFSGNETS